MHHHWRIPDAVYIDLEAKFQLMIQMRNTKGHQKPLIWNFLLCVSVVLSRVSIIKCPKTTLNTKWTIPMYNINAQWQLLTLIIRIFWFVKSSVPVILLRWMFDGYRRWHQPLIKYIDRISYLKKWTDLSLYCKLF